MSRLEHLALKALYLFDPEKAHTLALLGLRSNCAPLSGPLTSPRLQTEISGLKLGNPIGLAAGFDKNAQAISQLSRAGFGFIEVGAVTPLPQPGNPKPRLFRLSEDKAVINRFGFNNEGMEVVGARLKKATDTHNERNVPLGLNLGANKTSTDKAEDFAKVLRHCGNSVDFATVNVSSPNTEKLRDLQGAEALASLLEGVMNARDTLEKKIPIFLKIAPDLEISEIKEIAQVATNANIDAIIATNTTLERKNLHSKHQNEQGGLSGQPLFEKSTQVLAQLSKELDAKIPLIGVGGVSSATQAYAKIRAGASAIQLYSAMVYQGLSLAGKIAIELDQLLENDGFEHISHAVGVDRDDWL